MQSKRVLTISNDWVICWYISFEGHFPGKGVLEKKEMTTAEALCEGLPQEFSNYFNHPPKLSGKPKHTMLRTWFRDLFRRQGFEHNLVFDWTVLKYFDTLQSGARGGTSTTNRERPRATRRGIERRIKD